MISKIYFDLDGVLADFDCGVEEIAGINRNGANANSNVNDDDMWLAIAKVPNFYSKLELMPRAKTLFDTVYKMYGERVEILTGIPKPKRNILTVAQDKVNWVHRMLGPNVKVNTVLREEKKNFCTGEDCILVDDLQKNIDDWEALGGIGILYISAETTLEKLLCATSLLDSSTTDFLKPKDMF